jgi:hypothetical protein
VARWYAPFAVAGFLFLITVGVMAMLPVLWGFVTRVGQGLSTGTLTPDFWLTVVSTLLAFGPLVVVTSLRLRKRLRDRPITPFARSDPQEGMR